MSNYPDYELVQKCLQVIEEKLGWGISSDWHNDVFLELNEKIFEVTQVQLSPTTLKRVWGRVNYQSAPSISTLNALAQFAGYENWRDFKVKTNNTKGVKITTRKISKKRTYLTMLVTGSLAVFMLIFLLMGNQDKTAENKDFTKVKFSSRPITKGLPNSVIFDFYVPDDNEDVFIQQFWDPTKTIKINPGQKQATGIYYYPGYYRAKLVVDGAIVKENDLFITTNNWVGTIDYKPIPEYIYREKMEPKELAFSSETIDKIKTSEKPLYSTFHLIKDMGEVSADNFSMETELRNVFNENWAVCQFIRIVILGDKGALIIPFSIPGCVSDNSLMLNDVYLDGKQHDLSAFGTDFSDFRKIGIIIDDKNVSVFADGAEVYSGNYNDPVGRLVGLRYKFLGAGEVKSLEIGNLKTGVNITNIF